MNNRIEVGDTVMYAPFFCNGLVVSLSDIGEVNSSNLLLDNGMHISTVSHHNLILVSKAIKRGC